MIVLRGHRKPVQHLAFSPDGWSLASSGVDRVNFWDATAAKVKWNCSGDYCSRVAFAPDGRSLAIFAERLGIYRTSDGKRVRLLKEPMQGYLWPAFSPDAKQFAAISYRDAFGRSFIYRWNTGKW